MNFSARKDFSFSALEVCLFAFAVGFVGVVVGLSLAISDLAYGLNALSEFCK